MTHARVVLAMVVLLAGLLAAPVGAQGSQAGGSAAPASEPGHAPAQSTMEMDNGAFFIEQFKHLHPHAKAHPELSTDPATNAWLVFYDVNLYQLGAVLFLAVLFTLVLTSFNSGRAPWLFRVLRGWCHWLRDEVVIAVMGKEEGERWAPFFIYLFFFIAALNLVGLVPHQVTATACVFVTGGLAVVILAIMIGGGMLRQGPLAFWKNLLPHGLPPALIPLMAVVEVVGLFVKPFALMIRLFANMLAGHLLIYSFIGLMFVFAKMLELSAASYLTALPVYGMALFINIIEALVVLLQAYIFTYLSVLFVQASLHPEH